MYQQTYWLVAEGVVLGVICFFLLTLSILFLINKKYIIKKANLSDESTETRFWRNSKIIIQAFVYLCLGFAIVLAVGFGQLQWGIGSFLMFITYTFIFTHLLRDKEGNKEEDKGLLPSEPEGESEEDSHKEEYKYEDHHEHDNSKSSLQRRYMYVKRWLIGYANTLKDAVLNNKKKFAIAIISILFISIISTISSDCLCVAVNPTDVSSKLSRSWSKSPCAGKVLCHVYLTMADSSNDIIVNFHTTQNLKGVVRFDVAPFPEDMHIRMYTNSSQATVFKMENIVEEERYVGWAELSGLDAGTSYYFVIELSDDHGVVVVSQQYKLRTVPETDEGYNFISGGDMSSDDYVIKLSKLASATNPYFAMIGGDVAYDNGFATCYRRWDHWFNNWNNYMVTHNGGYLIPAILAVGNHEAGGFDRYGATTPFYTAYFPQQLGLQYVNPWQRVAYHHHKIGKKGHIVVLDSNVINTMDGAQAEWLDNTLNTANEEQRNAKFVLYHASIYATVPVFATTISELGKKHWTPLFDKHNVTIAFENHLHVYKRTKPLRADKITTEEEGGVVYLGDGSWGVNPRLIPASYSWYMEVMEKKSHVYSVYVNNTHVSTEAIGVDGKIFDQWQRYL